MASLQERLQFILAQEEPSPQQREELAQMAEEQGFEDAFALLIPLQSPVIKMNEEQTREVWKNIKPKRKTNWWPYAAAAALIIAMACLWIFQQPQKTESTVISPGKVGAILKLSDGRIINLDEAKGTVAKGFTKTTDALTIEQGTDVEFATLECPAGRTIHTIMADGSQVWLNAGSSIRFATNRQRNISLTGEAYFEVNASAALPFSVQTQKETITALGTSFNINNYPNEPAGKTTLIKGRLTVNNQPLNPGEQMSNGNKSNANIEQTLAWKNGLFQFDNLPLKEMMRQIERWYNVQVEYKGRITEEDFMGEIPRNTELKDLLKLLEATGLKFTTEGRKIMVSQ